MIIRTFFSPLLIADELNLKDRVAIVIDVLRASATICYALNNGAREVIPVQAVERAVSIGANLDRKVRLLAGERQGIRLNGFDLGNSPTEFSRSVVQGKTIVFTTSNGTQALAKTKHARLQLIGSFVNLSKLVEFLKEHFHEEYEGEREIQLVCAGSNGGFAYEDALCAGAIAEQAVKLFPETELSDSTMAALDLYKSRRYGMVEFIKTTRHARHLMEIGFLNDIGTCFAVDSCPVVPIMVGTSLKLSK